MAKENKNEPGRQKQTNAIDAILYLLLRGCDSGYVGWILVAAFVLALVFLVTKNLDSKDTLSMIQGAGTLYGFAWLGWIIAIIEIPLMRWLLEKKTVRSDKRIKDLEEENEKARTLLKGYKQQELGLENED